MTRFRSVVVRSVGILLGLSLSGLALAEGTPGCVDVSFYAIYRVGYDHIVHLANHCDKASVCSVKTNVNPNPIIVTVPAKEDVDVLTFRGSPARVFTPHVTCTDAK